MESARTPVEELAAFRVAADWGRVWEVNRLRPEDAVTDGRKMTGDWLLQLEWLPSWTFYFATNGVVSRETIKVNRKAGKAGFQNGGQ